MKHFIKFFCLTLASLSLLAGQKPKPKTQLYTCVFVKPGHTGPIPSSEKEAESKNSIYITHASAINTTKSFSACKRAWIAENEELPDKERTPMNILDYSFIGSYKQAGPGPNPISGVSFVFQDLNPSNIPQNVKETADPFPVTFIPNK